MNSYTTTRNGKPVTVAYDDGSLIKDAADLWAIVQGEYKGTPSMESEALKKVLADLQEGRPLPDTEWATLVRLMDKYGERLAAFRESPENEAEGFIPLPEPGTGRLLEALRMLPPGAQRLREGEPLPPRRLRLAGPATDAKPMHHCASCLMYDYGVCWGYGCLPVGRNWLCDSWEADPDWREQDFDLLSLAEPSIASLAEARRMREDAPLPVGPGNIVKRSYANLALGQSGNVLRNCVESDGAITHDVEWADGTIEHRVRDYDLRRIHESEAAADAPTGVMVALYPSTEIAADIAQDDGEDEDDLHLTLAFLGDQSMLSDPSALKNAVGKWAAKQSPMEGVVSGTGQFTTGPEPVTYASVDVPALPEARQALVDQLGSAGLQVSQAHGFTPHITLAYDDISPDLENHPLVFDHVALCMGAERWDFPLSGIPSNTMRLSTDALLDAAKTLHDTHQSA